MSADDSELIDKYFDDQLTEQELRTLQDWLARDPHHRRHFAQVAMLHNQLHGQVQTQAALAETSETRDKVDSSGNSLLPTTSWVRRASLLGAIAATILLMFLFFRGSQSAQAGSAELRRVIAANSRNNAHAFLIEVESKVAGGARQRRRSPEDSRRTKPPLDGARLHVRRDTQFVLERTTIEGLPFITGSDGKTSWMVPPTGVVRVSRDLQHFNRDVPGHEFSMSLCNLHDALEQLERAYQITALPIEYAGNQDAAATSTRLLVATKRQNQPGPRRVEITYQWESGQIEELRFIDMPYGPDHLNVRVSWLDEDPVTDAFFHHTTHHTPDREVESD